MASEDQFHKLLADRKKQASQQQDIVDIKKFKSEVLSFIEENQSFEGILSETYDAEGRRKSHGQLECVDITSELVVPDCVSMLKSQARQANCSLDLLAAELLSKKMCQAIQACQNGRTQFLNDKQKAVMSTIILIIKTLLKENSFNRVHFAKCLSSHHQDNSNNVPLEVLWSLHTSHITSFNTYLACCSYNSASCRSLTQGLIDICNTSPHVTQDKQVVTLSVFLGILLPLAYKDKTNNDKRSNLEKVAEEILQNVIEGSMNSCTDESSKEQSRLDIFEVIRHVQHLPDQTIMRFFSDQLHKMLFKPSVNSTVSYAVRNQNKWNFASLKEQTRTRFQQFLYMFKHSTIMEQLSQAFTRKEVDWQTLLSFLAVFLVCQEEAGALIKEYTDGLLQDVMATCDSHTMAVLLLVIRQASLEGAHVFPSYLTWFKSKFGNMATTPLSNRKTIQFFTQFLTDLVPCEPPYYLKVHIIKSPQVPSKLRDFVHDYDSLARTRLMDLKEPVELTGVYNLESSVLTQTEERTEQQKLQEQASKEVEKVLDSYGKTGKVPGSVMEASIFRKPYFIGRFLPALLTPRKLPESSDTRSKLINTLSKAGKISSTMLEAYFKACEKMAFDHDDSSEDDSALSDVDKLKKNLKSLTQDVICFIQKNDKITKTSISAKISLLAGHINSMVKTDQNVPCTSPVVIDVNSPCLDAKSIQVVDALLNSFCCMCTATRTIKCDHQMRFKWSADIVAMVMSISVINAALYYRLWDLLCSKGALSLTIQHIQGLAAFLCRLSSHQTPVLLMNTDNIMYKEQHGNSLSFIEVIFNLVPFSTHEWMEFSIRLCSAYLQHAAESSSVISILSATEKPQAVVKSTCFVPQSLIKKLWYLMHRFSFSAFCSQDCKSYEGIIDTINTVKATTLYQRLTDEAPKVSFDEWLMWELSIQRDEDIFSDTDRAQYHDATVLGYFTPLGVNDGGCGNSYRTACTMIIDRILDTNQMTQDRTDNNCQYNRQRNNTRKLCTVDLISLLERTLHLMVIKPQDKLSSGETRLPWLQQQYFRRIEKLKEIDIEYSTPASVLVEQETRVFTDLMLHLPSHLVFSDRPDKPLSKGDVSTASSFINSTLRLYTGVPCCFPLNITTYLLKGIISLSRVKDESLYFNESIIKQFCKECPLFFVSLQHYWEQVSVSISCMFCNNDTPSVLCDGQSLHQWIISFCCGSSVSKATPMAYPSWILAPCLFLGLQNSKNPVDCFQRLYTMIDTVFINKISVCLFACILSTFVEMVLHGHEISENKNTWDIAMELLKSYPNILACFMVDSNDSEELHQLRTLILPDKHSKLLPVVYFSLLTECTPTVIEKVKQFPQFTQVSIKMNQEFTELRKMCLEDKTYKSCEKPFQLEFARKVFQFLRHHAGS